MSAHSKEVVERIRALNDELRTKFRGGTISMSASVSALPEEVRAQALCQMAAYNGFSIDNDRCEHDFGAFEFFGRKWFWKIDYYDSAMHAGSEDPSDPSKTQRVLTLMLAEDY